MCRARGVQRQHRSVKMPVPAKKGRENSIKLSLHEIWTLVLIAQYGDVIPHVLQAKGRRKKPEKCSMSLGDIEHATNQLLDKNLVARPGWLNVFTTRYFVTEAGIKWLTKNMRLPLTIKQEPSLTEAEQRRAGMW